MEMQLLPWIKDDIAIEIIGKMIAEQTTQLYKIVAEHESAGFKYDSDEVLNDDRYVEATKRISNFNKEIDQIYQHDNLDSLYKKVDDVYAPYLKAKYEKRTVPV